MQADGKPDPSYRMKKNPQGQYIPLNQSEGQSTTTFDAQCIEQTQSCCLNHLFTKQLW